MTEDRVKRVLLTGASGEIGGEVARRLAGNGVKLALSGRRATRLERLAGEITAAGGTPPLMLPCDLARPGAAAGLATSALDGLGGVDVLINNAGASIQGLSWVVGDRDSAREVFETNLWSPLGLIAALAPAMIARGGGAVVNVGSMVQVSPFPHLGTYSASRAALALATQALDLELGPRGIRVVEVALGPVDTPASQENRILAGAEEWMEGRPGLGTVAAAAATIVAAAEGDASGVTFYPRVLRWPHRLPSLGRRYSRRMAGGADLYDETVR